MDFVVYHIRDSAQFWSELEDTLNVPADVSLAQLDAALETFIGLCASYHQEYLPSRAQVEQACRLLLKSELFTFHSERSSEIMLKDAQTNTNPHAQYIIFHILLGYGQLHNAFFRSVHKWQPLLPIIMDHLLVEMDEVVTVASIPGLAVPIEARLRVLAVQLMYEVCKFQKMSIADLRMFDDAFIGYLFDMVEHTRAIQEEELSYSLIKLIVALNEQFMVASIPPTSHHHGHGGAQPPVSQDGRPGSRTSSNRVLNVLMRRLGSSKTFGENMIFMLNRADGSPEALCMQLLILKMLYLLFTTEGTQEYFYTNDLCVLVDVFIRELNDLPEESESLRHTYLRVLHPLLTNTQLRLVRYKRIEIRRILLSLIANSHIREVNPTTKRLVERSLSAPWCSDLGTTRTIHTTKSAVNLGGNGRVQSDEDSLSGSSLSPTSPTSAVEALIPHVTALRLGTLKNVSSNQSSASVDSVAAALPGLPKRPRRSSRSLSDPSTPPVSLGQIHPASSGDYLLVPLANGGGGHHHLPPLSPILQRPVAARKIVPPAITQNRSAPPTPPPKRRKPPAVPDRRHKYTTVTIASSAVPDCAAQSASAPAYRQTPVQL